MENIVPFTEFDGANVKLSKLRTLDNGGKMVYLSFNERQVIVQTPEMSTPFGLSKWENEDKRGNKTTKYTIDMSFKGMETRETLQTFYKALQDFDTTLLQSGVQHGEDWVNKELTSIDMARVAYTPVIRKSKGDKYPATFKMAVPFDQRTNEFTCKVYNKSTKERMDLNDIDLKGAKTTGIVQCTGIWIAGGRYGTTWKVIQLLVDPPAKIADFAFRKIAGDSAPDLEDDEDDAEVNPTGNDNASDDLVASEDDEIEKKPTVKKVQGKK